MLYKMDPTHSPSKHYHGLYAIHGMIVDRLRMNALGHDFKELVALNRIKSNRIETIVDLSQLRKRKRVKRDGMKNV